MTVLVTLHDGTIDEFLRSGDAYVKHLDGTLDVIRGGSNQPHRYAVGQWTDVQGTQKRRKTKRFWSRSKD